MPEFQLTTHTPRPFAYLERACGANDVSVTVRNSFAALKAAFLKANVTPSGAPLAHFSTASNGVVTVRLGFPVETDAVQALTGAGLVIGDTFAGQALSGVHIGDYKRLGDTYDAMRAAIAKLGLAAADETWERYIGGSTSKPEEPRIEVLWPLRAA
jgi:hypothetical protein